jgi:uncharacterized membrane protein
MSDTVSSGAGEASSSGDRALGGEERLPVYIIYALYFIAPFTSGVTALIGVVTAYVLKRPGVSIAQGHLRFQIKVFWIALMMVVPLTLALLGGLTAFFMQLARGVDIATMTLDPWVIPVAVVAGLLAAGSTFWLWGASLFGLLKLANNRPAGRDA